MNTTPSIHDKITVVCTDANCKAYRNGDHRNYFWPDADDRAAVVHENWRDGVIAVQRDTSEDVGWFVYIDDMADPCLTIPEAVEFAAAVTEAANRATVLNAA
jgi:hypothetical protein